MKENNSNLKTIENTEELNLADILYKIWKDRNIIYKWSIGAVIIAIIIGFSIPKVYTSTVKLAPEITESTGKSSNLSGLASMAGVNLGPSGGDALSPALFPEIVKSTPFLLDLLSVKVKSPYDESSLDLYTYISEYQKAAWWSYVFGFPSQVVSWVKKLFGSSSKDEKSEVVYNNKNGIYSLSKEEMQILANVRNSIFVEIDKKTFVITISVTMQDPEVTAIITEVVLNKLQEYITTYRTQKAILDWEFSKKVYEEAKERYYHIQKTFALFEDANKNIVTSSFRTEKDRLYNEVNIAFSVYNSLAQKVENNKLRVQEITPVFTVIEPTKVPLFPSAPRKIFIIVGFLFLGIVFSIIYILIKDKMKFFLKSEI